MICKRFWKALANAVISPNTYVLFWRAGYKMCILLLIWRIRCIGRVVRFQTIPVLIELELPSIIFILFHPGYTI